MTLLALNTPRNSLGLLVVDDDRNNGIWLETALGKRRDKVSSNQMGSISRGSPPRPEVTAAESPVYTSCSPLPRLPSRHLIFIRCRNKKKIANKYQCLACFILREIFIPLIIHFHAQNNIYLLIHIFHEFFYNLYLSNYTLFNTFILLSKLI